MATPFILIIAVLTIESSYLDEVERPATTVEDTVQFLFSRDSQWRIKTFAIDHDIHVHKLDTSETRLSVERAKENIRKTYGDVTSRILVINFLDPASDDDVQRTLKENKLNRVRLQSNVNACKTLC
jgi:hypothetical protein